MKWKDRRRSDNIEDRRAVSQLGREARKFQAAMEKKAITDWIKKQQKEFERRKKSPK